MKTIILQILKAACAVAVVTCVLVLFLAFLLYKFNLSDMAVTVGIIIIYVISNFVGGFIIGKVRGEKKYIWGIVVGLTFFGTLTLLSIIITGELYGSGLMALVALVSCCVGGMAGGMVS